MQMLNIGYAHEPRPAIKGLYKLYAVCGGRVLSGQHLFYLDSVQAYSGMT